MKKIRMFCVLAAVVCLSFFLAQAGLRTPAEIAKTSEGRYDLTLWGSMIADSVNTRQISFLVDSRDVTADLEFSPYMDENLNLMIPMSLIRDYFACAIYNYNADQVIMEQNTDRYVFTLWSDELITDDSSMQISVEMLKIDEEIYLPAEDIAGLLGYSYTWDMENYQASVTFENVNRRVLPYRYDYREHGRMPAIRDQEDLGTCWTFASLTALSSSLLPSVSLDFSADHMSIQNSFLVSQNDGGDFTMAMAYLTAWQGPVLEEEDPYGDGYSPDGLSPSVHVQEIRIIESKDYEQVKEMVYKYGGVQTSLYTSLVTSSESASYNEENYSYCYIGTEKPNHDVVIIGWDDNYPAENFSIEPEGDGAFICQNSWGSGFGEDGVFYVSYYDTNIGMYNIVYTGIGDTDNYDSIYQTDLCGWTGQIGYSEPTAYFSNVYTAEANESVDAVGFYATDIDTEYEVYIVKNFEDENSFSERIFLQDGYIKNAGFYTIDLKESIDVSAGERFAVVVMINTPNVIHPVAIEFAAGATTSIVDLSDGEGYISLKGESWSRTESTYDCNLCLKVYTSVR